MITNSFDPQTAAGFVRRFQNLEAEFASEKGKLMKALKDDKAALLDEAEGAGIPKKLLKLECYRRKADAKFQERRERLDTDEVDQLDLFASAVARGMGEAEDDVDTFTSLGDALTTVIDKAADAVIVNAGDKGKPSRKSTKTEDRVAARAKAVGKTPADPSQTDIDVMAKEATERDFAEADPDVVRAMDQTTAERISEPAE